MQTEDTADNGRRAKEKSMKCGDKVMVHQNKSTAVHIQDAVPFKMTMFIRSNLRVEKEEMALERAKSNIWCRWSRSQWGNKMHSSPASMCGRVGVDPSAV